MTDLTQLARDIAADQYIRLAMKRASQRHTATEWAEHIQSYTAFMREGSYDDDISVQSALAALRGAQ
jgi:hypothetical protein